MVISYLLTYIMENNLLQSRFSPINLLNSYKCFWNNIKRLKQPKSYSAQSTVEAVSYIVSEGPGSWLKTRGKSLEWSLFIDRQLGAGDSALISFSSKLLIFSQPESKTSNTDCNGNKSIIAIVFTQQPKWQNRKYNKLSPSLLSQTLSQTHSSL